jgi:TonB family protein
VAQPSELANYRDYELTVVISLCYRFHTFWQQPMEYDVRKAILLALSFGLFLGARTAQSSPTQSKQPDTPAINLESLLTDAGYKPIKVRDGTWGLSGLSYQGKNLKGLDAFVEVNPNNGLLRVSARIGFHDHQDQNVELKSALDDLTKRLKPTEFSLSKQSVFAVTESTAEKLDRILLVQAIEKAAGEADKAYPDLAKFLIKVPGPESTGPGAGEGLGTRQGGGVGPADPDNPGSKSNSGTIENNKPLQVDSRPGILYKPQPVYTDEARKNQIQGIVTLRIVVDETGVAKNIRVIRGLPDGLSEQAIEVVRKMKFRPAMKDGKPVSFPLLLEINFFLH